MMMLIRFQNFMFLLFFMFEISYVYGLGVDQLSQVLAITMQTKRSYLVWA